MFPRLAHEIKGRSSTLQYDTISYDSCGEDSMQTGRESELLTCQSDISTIGLQ